MFTRMISKEGIKCFDGFVIASIIKEFKQIDEILVPGETALVPIYPDLLTQDQKVKLRML